MQVQSEEFMRAYVRLKPVPPSDKSVLNFTTKQITISRMRETFEFDEVFSETATNAEVFDQTVQPLIPCLLQGYNSCILAYGQTSSGKTHTMKGQEVNLGLIPLTIKEIFRRIASDELIAKVRISYFEIYNENIIDLLSEVNPPRYLDIRDDGKKNITIVDLIEQEVSDEMESLTFYDQGEQRRRYASNNINFNSSRSHAIFRISLDIVKAGCEVLNSSISMVDLAGSESISKTNAIGVLKKEGENINRSLLSLSNVIRGMSEKSNYVNFRDSRLTRILQPCLVNNSRSVIICTVQQTDDNVSETLNTLRFGVAANSIKVAVRKNFTPIENDNKFNELQNILNEERAMRHELQRELSQKKMEIDRCTDKLISKDALIQTLKHQLLVEESINVNQGIQLEQFKRDNSRTNSNNIFIENSLTNVAIYEDEIKKMKEVLAEKNLTIKDLQKEVATLEKNERTLLDKINKFERELETLQNSIQTNIQPTRSQPVVTFYQPSQTKTNEQRKSISYKKETFYQMANPQITSPYTIGKVIQLSTKILDLKIEINQYIQANAQLQEEVDNLNSKIDALENDKRAEEDIRSQKSRNSEGSKNLTIRQIEYIRKQNRKLNKINEDLKRKQIKFLRILKKNARNQIEELEGFNQYIEKNFGSNEISLFEMLTQESAEDYAPINANN